MVEIQLVVTTPPGQVHMYPVTRDQLTIGRSGASDIALNDPGVSRHHARLHRTPAGFEVEDLGSTNGTWLRGESITRASLQVGEAIRIANSTLRLQQAASPVPAEPNPQTVDELTMILASSAMEMELPDLSQPRLVIHTGWRTWEVFLAPEATTIGRQSTCQVVLQDANVSRQHAHIVREADAFVLVDLDSHNGTWLNDRRIERHTLRPGDSFRIGDATLVFNAPLSDDNLTIGLPQPIALPLGARRPVVFIPGFMGSELWRGSERIWPNVKALFTHPEIYRFPSSELIEARQLVSEVVIVPRFLKIERYKALGDFLCDDLGYERGKDLLEFPWDWRLDPRVAARQLGEQIELWRERVKEARLPVTLISHSLGCLVSRYYVEKLDGYSIVNRMVMLGGAHNGMPKTLEAFGAFGKQPFIYGIAEPFQRAIASAPSVYTMLPTYPSVFDSYKSPINLYHDENWCPEEYREHLRNAVAFRQELGTKCRVPSICVFGYGIQTPTRAVLESRNQTGGWDRIHFLMEDKGDSTIPEESAHLQGAEIHPVHQHHAALYMDNDVKMRLRLELTR
jgi:pSer/pThr/pTyr-binding forkhead associated (FHA) protein